MSNRSITLFGSRSLYSDVATLSYDLEAFTKNCMEQNYCCKSCCKSTDDYSERIRNILNRLSDKNTSSDVKSRVVALQTVINSEDRKISKLKDSCFKDKYNRVLEANNRLYKAFSNSASETMGEIGNIISSNYEGYSKLNIGKSAGQLYESISGSASDAMNVIRKKIRVANRDGLTVGEKLNRAKRAARTLYKDTSQYVGTKIAANYDDVVNNGSSFSEDFHRAKETCCQVYKKLSKSVFNPLNAIRLTANHLIPSRKQPSPDFSPFGPHVMNDELAISTLSYLGREDHRVLNYVDHNFQRVLDKVYLRECRSKNFVPESLPAGVTHRQFLLSLFSRTPGIGCIEEWLGALDPADKKIPVPRRYIEKAIQSQGKIFFRPEFITIDVDENSPFELDSRFAVGDNKARLVENPARKDWVPTGKPKKLRVPVTFNNLILLVQKRLKKQLPAEFRVVFGHVDPRFIDQCGDKGVGPSRWCCHTQPITSQRKPEIVPLTERVLFHLLNCMNTGKIPDESIYERTSTIVKRKWWFDSDPVGFVLSKNNLRLFHSNNGTAALGIP